jgi:hypothetical protein
LFFRLQTVSDTNILEGEAMMHEAVLGELRDTAQQHRISAMTRKCTHYRDRQRKISVVRQTVDM